MLKKSMLIMLLFILLISATEVDASVITGEKSLAGMSYIMDKCIEETGSIPYPEDIELLAEVMYHENWHTDAERLAAYYTGAVVMNRVNSKRWPNTIKAVLYQKGQYSTTGKFFTKELPAECYHLAAKVAKGTPDVPENVVFQAMFKQGSGVWKKVNTDYFCYE